VIGHFIVAEVIVFVLRIVTIVCRRKCRDDNDNMEPPTEPTSPDVRVVGRTKRDSSSATTISTIEPAKQRKISDVLAKEPKRMSDAPDLKVTVNPSALDNLPRQANVGEYDNELDYDGDDTMKLPENGEIY